MIRTTAILLFTGVALAAAATQLHSPATAEAGRTVCKNDIPRNHAAIDVERKGRTFGRVWVHQLRDHSGCIVLRARKWKGTPHYMFVRVCDKLVGPRKPVGCTGFDAGLYSFYAGPIYYPRWFCQVIHVKIDSPTGKRVVDQYLHGPCD